MDALAVWLEGSVQRTREFHESMINSIKEEQLKFQSKIRSTLTSPQVSPISQSKKPEGSVHKLGVSPNSVVVYLGNEGFGPVVRGSGVQGEGGSYGVMGAFCGSGVTHMMGNGGAMVGNGGQGGGLGMMNGMGTRGWRYRKLDMPVC